MGKLCESNVIIEKDTNRSHSVHIYNQLVFSSKSKQNLQISANSNSNSPAAAALTFHLSIHYTFWRQE